MNCYLFRGLFNPKAFEHVKLSADFVCVFNQGSFYALTLPLEDIRAVLLHNRLVKYEYHYNRLFVFTVY